MMGLAGYFTGRLASHFDAAQSAVLVGLFVESEA
jgi:hypothetical protein